MSGCRSHFTLPKPGAAAAVDGDRPAVIVNGHRAPNVRLWGVDAPEMRDTGKVETVAGMRARVALAELGSGLN